MANYDNVALTYDARRIVTPNSSAAAGANATLLNAWSGSLDTAKKTQEFGFPGGDCWINAPWVLDHSQGGVISGKGMIYSPWGESQPTQANKSHGTRIIGAGLTSIIDERGSQRVFRDLSLHGYTAVDLTALIAAFAGGMTGFAEAGLRLGEFQGGTEWGPANPVLDNVSIVGCQTAIYCGATDTGNQADHIFGKKVSAILCGTVLKGRNLQSVNHVFTRLDARGVNTVLDFDLGAGITTGGSVDIHDLYLSDYGGLDTCTFLKTGVTGDNNCDFHVGRFWIDGTLGNVNLWDCGRHAGGTLTIDFLRIPNGGAVEATLTGSNHLEINGGRNLHEQMFTLNSASSDSFQPRVTVRNASFATGQNPLNMVNLSAGTGTGYVFIENVKQINATGGPSMGLKQTWGDHVLVATEYYATSKVMASTTAATLTPVSGVHFAMAVRTGQAEALTINAPSGTADNGYRLMVRIEDNGTTRALTWNSIYRAFAASLPANTTAGKTHYVEFIYNATDAKWDCLLAAVEP